MALVSQPLLPEAEHHLSRDLLGNSCLKAEISSQLAKAFTATGEPQQSFKELTRGLASCEAAAKGPTSSRPELLQWCCYFHQQRSNALMAEGNLTDSAAVLAEGRKLAEAENLPQQLLQFRLMELQLSMLAWDRAVTERTLSELHPLLEGDAGAGLPADTVHHYQLHYTLLKVLYGVRMGKCMRLTVDANNKTVEPPVVIRLRLLLRQASSGAPSPFAWVPLSTLGIVVELLGALLQRLGGRLSFAKECLSKGDQAAGEELASLGVHSDTREAAHADLPAVHLLLVLQFMVRECRTQIQLAQGDLEEARDGLLSLAELQSRFPQLLRGLLPSLHALAGQYALNTRSFDPGQSPSGTWREPDKDLGAQESVVLLLSSAAVCLRLNDSDGAKAKLSQALRRAHNTLGCHQIICSVLNCLAPLHGATGDSNGASKMISSSISLADMYGDNYTGGAARRALTILYEKLGNDAECQDTRPKAMQKLVKVESAVAAAKSDVGRHKAALGSCF
ncbi:MAG: hypothetical protein WDW38_004371 [Sanguina aurantia]